MDASAGPSGNLTEMPTKVLTSKEFKSSLVDRYSQPLELLRCRVELESLLEARGVFHHADLVTELLEQLRLIFQKLGQISKEAGSSEGFDLSEQARTMCDEVLNGAQQLALTLPQAALDLTGKASPENSSTQYGL